jgi:hypothetical protein
MRRLLVATVAVAWFAGCSDADRPPDGVAGSSARAGTQGAGAGGKSNGGASGARNDGGSPPDASAGNDVGGSGQSGEDGGGAAAAGEMGVGGSGGNVGRGGRGAGGTRAGRGGDGGTPAAGTNGESGASEDGGVAGTAGAAGTAGLGGAGAGGGGSVSCATADDCQSALGSPSGCKQWSCESSSCVPVAPTCTDEDGDGLFSGPACACGEPDCEPDVAGLGGPLACFSGDPDTRGVGICRDGVRHCAGPATYGVCSGEVTAAAEACNGQDDDCDGETDEGFAPFTCGIGACQVTVAACVNGRVSACLPLEPATSVDGCNDVDDDCDGAIDEDCATCFHVAPDGNDAAAVSSGGTAAFGTVQAALDYADTHRNVAKRVCVASGTACGAEATFPGPTNPLTMRDGIDLLGKYESTTWTRCESSVTHLTPRTTLGVHFPPAVQSRTVLDGFTIARVVLDGANAVTVDGAKGVLLSNVAVDDDLRVMSGNGVLATNGADVSLWRCHIRTRDYLQNEEHPAVHAISARVSVQDSCAEIDPATGRCGRLPTYGVDIRCGGASVGRVLLEDSPGSRIERSSICDEGGPDRPTIEISGAADGTVVRANTVVHTQSQRGTLALEIRDCRGTAPWVVDNARLLAWAETVLIHGDCSAVLDSNQDIGGVPSPDLDVVRCDGAPCVLAANVMGAGNGNSPFGNDSIGVRCANGGCALISDNTIVATRRKFDSGLGVALEGSAAFVERNVIRAGYGSRGFALEAYDARSRIENNYLYGRERRCDGPGSDPMACIDAPGVGAMHLVESDVDVHSNLLSSGEFGGSFRCYGALLRGDEPVGTFRNNFVSSLPQCMTTELYVDGGGPRVFENNALDRPILEVSVGENPLVGPFPPPYVELTLGDLTDTVSSGNRVDGVLKDQGTSAGAPAYDFNRAPRDSTPDIGPVELP